RRFVTVHLHRREADPRRQLIDLARRLIHKDADRHDLARQRRDNRFGPLAIDEPRTVRPEHESERVGAELDGGARIFEASDSANLDEHSPSPNGHSRQGTQTAYRWNSSSTF